MIRSAPTILRLVFICMLMHGTVAAALPAPQVLSSLETPVRLDTGWQAIRTTGESTEPAADDPRWVDADVGGVLGSRGSIDALGDTWLRLTVVLPQTATFEGLGILVDQVDFGGVVASINGRPIGSWGPLEQRQPHVFAKPTPFEIPVDLIRPGEPFLLTLRVWRDPAYGSLPVALARRAPVDVKIGNTSDLATRAELARMSVLFERLDILVLGIVFIMAGLFHVQLYRRRREQTEYLWFGTIAIAAALNMIFSSAWGTASLDPLTAFYISRTAFHIAGASWVGFLWKIFGWKLGRVELAYMVGQCSIAIATVAAPNFFLVTLGDWPVFSLIVTLFLWFGVIPVQALRGNREARTICVGLFFLATARLWQMLGGFGFVPSANYVHWGFFGLVLAVAVSLSDRFSRVHQDLDQLNQNLEDTVARRTNELAATVVQLRESERLAIEAREAAQEASESKSLFLASMSHELRTPLNAILGFVQLLRRRHALNEETRHGLSVIMRSGEHLLSLINDILSITKIEAGQMTLKEEPFDLHGLLEHLDETFQPRAEAKGLALTVRRAGSVPRYVFGDDGKLRQILINLLGNAVRYTHSGSIDLEAEWSDGQAVFIVRDTGYGIGVDERGRLFTAFTQTASGMSAKEGTGLGLAISRANALLMQGDITVESTLDVGTTFVVTIVLNVVENVGPGRRAQRVVGLEPGQPDVRILVVDDVTENRHILSALLTDAGFVVCESSTGRDAIAKWESWKPDLIWMDIRMAGIDGISATKIIREREKETGGHCVIIALTASAFDTDRALILDAGCNDFVPKPFLDAVIFAKLREHLGVRYTYAEEIEDAIDPASSVSTSTLDLESLAALPGDWIDLLDRSVREGDAESAIEIADQIAERDVALADELRRLIRRYRFDEIAEALAGLRRRLNA